MDFSNAIPGDVSAQDVSGAIDTSNVTLEDVIIAGVVLVATVILATVVGHVTRQRLSRPETNTLQVARFAGTAARWALMFIGGAISLSFLGAESHRALQTRLHM